jgi:lipopolysaccharide biosynthesis glycosyltransferase
MEMSIEVAVCYVSDMNFLLGTLISLRSLRHFVPVEAAETYVFCVDPDLEAIERVQRAAAGYGATLVPLRIDDQIDLEGKSWNSTHVPRSTLGRFYIERHLPTHITRILYVDGDTLFVRDPSELVRFVPQAGKLAAAEDISYYARNDCGAYGAKTRAYFAGLGIDGSRGYLNAGLLLARREAWRSIVADAVRYFEQHSDKCRYHDQSALNAVIGDRRTRLSPLWNFQTPFCYWGVREVAEPVVFHFTEFPKPWMGDVVPWRFLDAAITDAVAEFSDLRLPAQALSAEQVQTYDRLRSGQARRLSSRMPVRLLLRRREFRRLMGEAAL